MGTLSKTGGEVGFLRERGGGGWEICACRAGGKRGGVRGGEATVGRHRRGRRSALPSPPPSPARGEKSFAKWGWWARAGEGGRGAAKSGGLSFCARPSPCPLP